MKYKVCVISSDLKFYDLDVINKLIKNLNNSLFNNKSSFNCIICNMAATEFKKTLYLFQPENILLDSKEKKIIKVADFGLAVEVSADEFKWFGNINICFYCSLNKICS